MDRRQRKLEEKRKKRDAAKKKARAAAERRPDARTRIVRLAAQCPFGPCYVSNGWDQVGEEGPTLVTAVVTRKLPDGRLVAGVALVDRTCLGVKDADVREPVSEDELDVDLDEFGAAHGGMVATDGPLVVQSIVYHAIDYARRLGFRGQPPDFAEELFGPRPAELLETPWHNSPRPIYFVGPNDRTERILQQLDEAVGPDNYDCVEDEWELEELGGEPVADDGGEEPPPPEGRSILP
jgi:hypothetical protein